jgi:hypothetical protein
MLRPLIFASVLALPVLSTPCISVSSSKSRVWTESERSVIVWDSKRGVEHFIRSADFDTDAKDFGFLVPTPSVPTLVAADPKLFATVEAIVQRKLPAPRGFGGGFGGGGSGGGVVEVIKQQRVAGYDATVLRASDAGAAEMWLKQNGYPVSRVAKEWLDPYVRNGWAITAFKISNYAAGSASLKPVMMSFAIDAPFYPYREPRQEKRTGRSRALDVYLLSDKPMKGILGNRPWIEPAASFEMTAEERNEVLGVLPQMSARPTHITVFSDRSNPRMGTHDVYFVENPKESKSVDLMLLVSALLGAAGLILGSRSRTGR